MELIDIVKKLCGDIKPIGETNYDEVVYSNVENFSILVIDLINELIEISEKKDAPQYSVSQVGKLADSLLWCVKNKLDELDYKIK